MPHPPSLIGKALRAVPLLAGLALTGCAVEGSGLQSQKLAAVKARGELGLRR